MKSRKFKIGFLFTAGLIILYIAFAWLSGKALIISLESYIIPAYPEDSASLKEVLRHFKNELAKQGKNVEIRVIDETGYNDKRRVEGIGGNGYIFLWCVSDVFDTNFLCRRHGVVIISGVGSKVKSKSEDVGALEIELNGSEERKKQDDFR